jgi:hypothetical protein
MCKLQVHWVKERLQEKFPVHDLGEVKDFLRAKSLNIVPTESFTWEAL